jgi:hypothetical protein
MFMAWSLALAMCDHPSGVVRFWRGQRTIRGVVAVPGFEEGNGNVRVFGTYKPCASGYAPGSIDVLEAGPFVRCGGLPSRRSCAVLNRLLPSKSRSGDRGNASRPARPRV